MQLLSGAPRFGGKAVYPTLEAALDAQKFKPKRSIDEIRAQQKEQRQLPGFTLNALFSRGDKLALQIIEHEDQQRYPGVLVLTNDDKGDHIKAVSDDIRTTILAEAFARLSLVGLESKAEARRRSVKPMELKNLHKALAALWDPQQVNAVTEFRAFQKKREREDLQDLRDKLQARIDADKEAKRIAQEKKDNRWFRRFYRWAFQ